MNNYDKYGNITSTNTSTYNGAKYIRDTFDRIENKPVSVAHKDVYSFASLNETSDYPQYMSSVPFFYTVPEYSPTSGWFKAADADYIGWTMLYGEKINFSGVLISWNRPKDGKTLSDSFNVRWEDSQ